MNSNNFKYRLIKNRKIRPYIKLYYSKSEIIRNLFDITLFKETYPDLLDIDKEQGYVRVKKWNNILLTDGITVNWKAGTVISFTPVKTGDKMHMYARIMLYNENGGHYDLPITDRDGNITDNQKIIVPKNIVSVRLTYLISRTDFFGFKNFMVSEKEAPFVPYV